MKYTLKSLPYGSVVTYRGQPYFKSEGLDGDILTGKDGTWHFIDAGHKYNNVDWKTFKVVYIPK